MIRPGRQLRLLPVLALGALLLAAHAAAALHGLEHDFDTLDAKACATCATVAQLGSACVDSPVAIDLDAPGSVPEAFPAAVPAARHAVPVRQRGPPANS